MMEIVLSAASFSQTLTGTLLDREECLQPLKWLSELMLLHILIFSLKRKLEYFFFPSVDHMVKVTMFLKLIVHQLLKKILPERRTVQSVTI